MSGKRILIVDDHKAFLLLLAHTLKKLGEDEIVLANDGFAALVHLKQQPFDLMMTDYNMPGMNGLELAQTARQMAPNLQIVLMSVQDLFEVKVEAQHRHLSLDGYLSKPFTLRQLQKVIKPVKT